MHIRWLWRPLRLARIASGASASAASDQAIHPCWAPVEWLIKDRLTNGFADRINPELLDPGDGAVSDAALFAIRRQRERLQEIRLLLLHLIQGALAGGLVGTPAQQCRAVTEALAGEMVVAHLDHEL